MLQLQVNSKATNCKIRKEANKAKSSRKKVSYLTKKCKPSSGFYLWNRAKFHNF
jgi:hypothetical protein